MLYTFLGLEEREERGNIKMNNYVVFLKMKDKEKSQRFREAHLHFLEEKRSAGQVLMYGPFSDGSGGMIIYQGKHTDEVREIASQDPYVIKGAREFEIKKWDVKKS
jgi:hypothetical protein